MVDACILEDISTFLTAVMSQSANASEKRSHSNGTKTESAAAKRSRTSVEHAATADDSAHPALTGHDYSQRLLPISYTFSSIFIDCMLFYVIYYYVYLVLH